MEGTLRDHLIQGTIITSLKQVFILAEEIFEKFPLAEIVLGKEAVRVFSLQICPLTLVSASSPDWRLFWGRHGEQELLHPSWTWGSGVVGQRPPPLPRQGTLILGSRRWTAAPLQANHSESEQAPPACHVETRGKTPNLLPHQGSPSMGKMVGSSSSCCSSHFLDKTSGGMNKCSLLWEFLLQGKSSRLTPACFSW